LIVEGSNGRENGAHHTLGSFSGIQGDYPLTVFQGIAGRDADLTKYMNPKKYIQHNPHAANVVDGLKEYIAS
jgi:hypothetical protein